MKQKDNQVGWENSARIRTLTPNCAMDKKKYFCLSLF